MDKAYAYNYDCDNSKGLYCLLGGNDGKQPGYCTCFYDSYWSTTLNQCVSKGWNGTSCSYSDQCRTFWGLTCIQGICTCSDSNQYGGYNPQYYCSKFKQNQTYLLTLKKCVLIVFFLFYKI